jgi:hypothetical protein
MQTYLLRTCAALSLVGLALAVAAPARAVTVPINFTGTEQNFDLTLDLTGNVYANGSGSAYNAKLAKVEPFKFTAPLNHAVTLFGGAQNISSDPITDPLGTTFDVTPNQLVNMTDLDIDFLNGASTTFAIDTITLTTNSGISILKAIDVDLSADLSGLRFDQTGAATVLGGPGSGTFGVLGDLTASLTNLNVVLFGLISVPVGDQSLSLPGALPGTWTMTSLGGPNWKVALDGNIDLNIPLSLVSQLTSEGTAPIPLTLSATIDLAAFVTINVAYHLEDTFVIPEPGSIALLGVGLCVALVPAVRKLRRRK